MKYEDFLKEFFDELTGSEQMNYSEFIKVNLDIPTLLGQLSYIDFVLEGIGGSLPILLYGETEEMLIDAADSMATLANDKNANRGFGVLPETACGAVEVIERLRALPPDEFAFVAFRGDGWGNSGLSEAYNIIRRNPFFRIFCDFAEKILIHERTGHKVILDPYEDSIAGVVWNAQDYIVYQTNNAGEPLASSVLALMIMKR